MKESTHWNVEMRWITHENGDNGNDGEREKNVLIMIAWLCEWNELGGIFMCC